MVREKNITVTAFSRKNSSEENISFSLIDVETKFKKHFTRWAHMVSPANYDIALEELIMEWDDYRTEVCGYVQCDL